MKTRIEVLDIFEMGGRLLASVKALDELAFVGGSKRPFRTRYANLPIDELAEYEIVTESEERDE